MSLDDIHKAWQTLTCSRPDILDPTTLRLLEGRCPRLSVADRKHIEYIFQDGSAFQDVSNPVMRSQLREAALKYPRIIPSLRTFLENTKYLRAMTDVIKRVLPPKFKGTIRESMLKCYVCPGDSKHQVQQSENDYVYEQGPPDFGFQLAYRQLFLFAMRHFFGLTDLQPLGLNQSSSKRRFDMSELWKRFRLCAANSGFVLPGSKVSKGPCSVRSMEFTAIHGLLTRLRPPELFLYDEARMAEWSTEIASLLIGMAPRRIDSPAAIQSHDNTEEWCLENRCGMTQSSSFFSDQRYLFLHNVYSEDQPARENMTTFAVKRDIFRTFFPDIRRDPPTPVDTPMNPAPMNPAPMDPAPMDLASINPTTMGFTSDTDTQVMVQQPEPLLLETGQSSQNISISQQTPDVCRCFVQMTPESFYSSFQPLRDTCPFIVFFHVPLGILEFVRHYNDHMLANLCDESQWFARVHERAYQLQTMTIAEVGQHCRKGPCLIFHGKGTFNTTFKPGSVEKISLPVFNSDTNLWLLPA